MAIAFVQANGTFQTKTLVAQGVTYDIPLTNLPSVGNLMVCMHDMGRGGVAPPGVGQGFIVDPRGNTWTFIGSSFGGTGVSATIVTNAYSAGDVIGVTSDGTFVFTGTIAEWSGVNSATPYGVASATAASITNPTVTTATSVSSGDLVVGFVTTGGPSGDTYSADTDTSQGSWASGVGTITRIGSTGGSATTNRTIAGQHKITTGGGTQTFNPVLGTARANSGIFIMAFTATSLTRPPRKVQVAGQAVQRSAAWMKRHSRIYVPRLWTPADGVA
jgi:hypothetical protein